MSKLNILGSDNLCITVLSSDIVVTARCDCNDRRQNFQWLRKVYLINSASGKCLSLKSFPPKHGDELTVKICPTGNAPVRQAWHAEGYRLSLMYNTQFGVKDPSSLLYKVEHNSSQKMVIIFPFLP